MSWRPRQPCWQGAGVAKKLVVPSARGARRGAESQVCPGRERAAASKLPCWGLASAPASLEARGPLQTLEPLSSRLCSEMALNPGFNLGFFGGQTTEGGGLLPHLPLLFIFALCTLSTLPITKSGIICRKLCKSGEAICL